MARASAGTLGASQRQSSSPRPPSLSTTVADHLADFFAEFEAEWRRRTTGRATRNPAADLDAEITKQAVRVDRLARAVAEVPDVAALLTQLRQADATLRELRARRAKMPGTEKAPVMPDEKAIRTYFDEIATTLERDPDGAREKLGAAFGRIRLVPLRESYRLEMTLSEIPTNSHCGGRLFGLPRTTFRALVTSSRGQGRVRVLTPRRAA